MSKNFKESDLKTSTRLRSSAQRDLRSRLIELYPDTKNIIEEFWPKKAQLNHRKDHGNFDLYFTDSYPIFFQTDYGPLIPSLRLVHQFPKLFKYVQADAGAIKHILSGANIMLPGLKSRGGIIPNGIKKGDYVAVRVEGKEHAIAVGKACLSSEEMQIQSEGIAIEPIEHLGDPLWKYKSK